MLDNMHRKKYNICTGPLQNKQKKDSEKGIWNMKKYRLRVGLDVDDTLYECNSYALSIINARYPDEEPISINEIYSL